MRKFWILISILIVVLVLGYFINAKSSISQEKPLLDLTPGTATLEPTPAPSPEETPASVTPPSSYQIIGFSFQSQAPLGNWDTLHEEACEEASLILVKYWETGKSLSAQTMEAEIQKMIAWENQNGYPKDLTAAQEVNLAKSYYNLENVMSSYDVSIDSIKKEIAQNHPVVVPAAGRLLGNPYFTSPGPVYHMLVIIGYDNNNFIVEDVGTRRGDHYRYNQTVLLGAIHEWNGNPDSINSGRKAMIVF
jgi:hypothetical protein